MAAQADQILNEARAILAQCIVAANEAAAAAAYIQKSGAAPLDSPHFTGVPTAPTAAQNTDSTQLATTEYLDRLLAAANGIPTLDAGGHIPTSQLPPSVLGGLTYQGVWNASTNTPTITSSVGTSGFFYIVNVAGTTSINGISSWAVGDWIAFNGTVWNKIPVAAAAPTNIPLSSLAVQAAHTFVGNSTGGPAAPTALSATTVTALLNAMVGDTGMGGTQGMVPAPAAGDGAANKVLFADGTWDVPPAPDLSAYATLLSPVFTGSPQGPTQAADTSNTDLATTAFVIGQASNANPVINGTVAPGTSKKYARDDHVHPTDTTRAPTASPALSGTPTTPTAAPLTNNTQIASTNYTDSAVAAALAAATPSCTVAFTLLTAAPTGWLLFADQTIGDASSGATYANAAAQAVFTALYAFSDANCPLLTSSGSGTTRGAQGSASAAWAAHCRMTMPKTLGRALAVAGSGAGLTTRAIGATVGEETHQLTVPELASHNHSITTGSDPGSALPSAPAQQTPSIIKYNTDNTGGDVPHNNMQPSSFLNVMVKL